MQFTASWNSRTGVQAAIPVSTTRVQTSTPVKSGSAPVLKPVLAHLTVTPPPAAPLTMRYQPTSLPGQPPAAPAPTQASALGRYALWGVIGLVGAVVLYKLWK
jgi:hypothetical protein